MLATNSSCEYASRNVTVYEGRFLRATMLCEAWDGLHTSLQLAGPSISAEWPTFLTFKEVGRFDFPIVPSQSN